LILTASLTWHIAPPTGWHWPRCAAKDTGRKTGSPFFRPSFTRVGSDHADVQIFLKAHNERNLAEYEGRMEIDEGLLADLIRCAKKLEAAVWKTRSARRRLKLSHRPLRDSGLAALPQFPAEPSVPGSVGVANNQR